MVENIKVKWVKVGKGINEKWKKEVINDGKKTVYKPPIQPKLEPNHWLNGTWTLNINKNGKLDGAIYNPPIAVKKGRKPKL